jgi:hypothetical protein
MEDRKPKRDIISEVMHSLTETLLSYPDGDQDASRILNFLRFSNKDGKNWVSFTTIHSREPFILCIKSVYNVLITYLPEEQCEALQCELQNQKSGVILAKNFIPVENMINVPGRDVNFFTIISRVFGDPIHGMLREDEVLRSKQLTKDEMDNKFYSKLYSCVPVLDKILALKIISRNEFEFIRDLLGVILQSEYNRYVGMVTQKDIMSTTGMMHKAGYIKAEAVNGVNNMLLNRTPISCEICCKLFLADHHNQKICPDHSNAEIQQHRRKRKGGGSWGGKRGGAGRKTKKK